MHHYLSIMQHYKTDCFIFGNHFAKLGNINYQLCNIVQQPISSLVIMLPNYAT